MFNVDLKSVFAFQPAFRVKRKSRGTMPGYGCNVWTALAYLISPGSDRERYHDGVYAAQLAYVVFSQVREVLGFVRQMREGLSSARGLAKMLGREEGAANENHESVSRRVIRYVQAKGKYRGLTQEVNEIFGCDRIDAREVDDALAATETIKVGGADIALSIAGALVSRARLTATVASFCNMERALEVREATVLCLASLACDVLSSKEKVRIVLMGLMTIFVQMARLAARREPEASKYLPRRLVRALRDHCDRIAAYNSVLHGWYMGTDIVRGVLEPTIFQKKWLPAAYVTEKTNHDVRALLQRAKFTTSEINSLEGVVCRAITIPGLVEKKELERMANSDFKDEEVAPVGPELMWGYLAGLTRAKAISYKHSCGGVQRLEAVALGVQLFGDLIWLDWGLVAMHKRLRYEQTEWSLCGLIPYVTNEVIPIRNGKSYIMFKSTWLASEAIASRVGRLIGCSRAAQYERMAVCGVAKAVGGIQMKQEFDRSEKKLYSDYCEMMRMKLLMRPGFTNETEAAKEGFSVLVAEAASIRDQLAIDEISVSRLIEGKVPVPFAVSYFGEIRDLEISARPPEWEEWRPLDLQLQNDVEAFDVEAFYAEADSIGVQGLGQLRILLVRYKSGGRYQNWNTWMWANDDSLEKSRGHLRNAIMTFVGDQKSKDAWGRVKSEDHYTRIGTLFAALDSEEQE